MVAVNGFAFTAASNRRANHYEPGSAAGVEHLTYVFNKTSLPESTLTSLTKPRSVRLLVARAMSIDVGLCRDFDGYFPPSSDSLNFPPNNSPEFNYIADGSFH
jgi:hypothetical protein